MPITISGSTGIAGVDGSAATPAVQGTDTNTGVYYPAADQVAIATNGAQRVLVDASGNMTVTGTLQANGVTGSVYPLVSGTAQASTSGVNIDFTGLPSWVKRITVMFNGVSTNGTAGFSIQLGTSAGIVSTGYSGGVGVGTTYNANSTAFFSYNSATAADLVSGAIVITSFGSNIWAAAGAVFQASNGAPRTSGGTVTLPGTLDRVRIATANGTDTFDAGSINILYE